MRDEGHGCYERTLLSTGPRGSQAKIEVRVDGILLNQQPVVYFVGERSEIGQPFVIGPALMGPRPSSSVAVFVALLLPLLGLWRRRFGAVLGSACLVLWLCRLFGRTGSGRFGEVFVP